HVAAPEAYDLLHRGSLALAEVEYAGIRVDVDYLDCTIAETDAKIKALEQKLQQDDIWRDWQTVFGTRATLGSREQLGHLLFRMMGYACAERTPTGRAKVDKNVLEKIDLSFVKTYLDMMGLKKIK